MEDQPNVNNLNGVENFGEGPVESIISEETKEDEKATEEVKEDAAGDGGEAQESDGGERGGEDDGGSVQ